MNDDEDAFGFARGVRHRVPARRAVSRFSEAISQLIRDARSISVQLVVPVLFFILARRWRVWTTRGHHLPTHRGEPRELLGDAPRTPRFDPRTRRRRLRSRCGRGSTRTRRTSR